MANNISELANAIELVLNNHWGLTDPQVVDRLRGVRQTCSLNEFKHAFNTLNIQTRSKLRSLAGIIIATAPTQATWA